MLYSVVFCSEAGTEDGTAVEMIYSVVLYSVGGTDESGDDLSGG